MAYELQIELPGEEIPMGEWIRAVEEVRDVKIDSSAIEFTNPMTGEVITLPGSEGNAAVLIDGIWEKCFRFSRGRGSFSGLPELENPAHPVRIAAAAIAQTLGAQITGEEGELYEW